MFHLAIPPVNGLTVTTPTPGLRRSFHLDLLRVAVAEAEDDDGVPDDAVVALLVPALVDQSLVNEVVDVVPVFRITPSAGSPLAACPWAEDGPIGRADVDAGTLRRLLELGDELVEDRPRSRVRDKVKRDVLRALVGPRRAATAVTTAAIKTEIQTNLFRCITLLESLACPGCAAAADSLSPFSIGKV